MSGLALWISQGSDELKESLDNQNSFKIYRWQMINMFLTQQRNILSLSLLSLKQIHVLNEGACLAPSHHLNLMMEYC